MDTECGSLPRGWLCTKCRKMVCRLSLPAPAGLPHGSLALTVSCVVTLLTPNFEARARTTGLMGNPGKVSDVNNDRVMGNWRKGDPCYKVAKSSAELWSGVCER